VTERLVPRDPGEWTFKAEDVAADFDRHVREALPWYDLATGVVRHVGRHFISRQGLVYDLGASTGNVGRALAPVLEQRQARLVAIDESAEMAKFYRAPGEFVHADVTKHDYRPADLIVCFLVLMFLPVSGRRQFIKRLTGALKPGGALLVFDKVEPLAGTPGIVNLRLTLAAKYEAGATPDEIIAKELALAGVQRPLRPDELEGFVPLFRFGDFGGWLHCE
jgi:tRNA (cmo5U34)-methyltransferase